MAELADAQDSGSCVRKDVEVRLLLPALSISELLKGFVPDMDQSLFSCAPESGAR